MKELGKSENEQFLKRAGKPGEWWAWMSNSIEYQNHWSSLVPLLKILLQTGDEERWLWMPAGNAAVAAVLAANKWKCPDGRSAIAWLVGLEGLKARGGTPAAIIEAVKIARQAIRRKA